MVLDTKSSPQQIHTQRHRDTETQRHRDTETQRQTDRQTHTHTHTHTHTLVTTVRLILLVSRILKPLTGTFVMNRNKITLVKNGSTVQTLKSRHQKCSAKKGVLNKGVLKGVFNKVVRLRLETLK